MKGLSFVVSRDFPFLEIIAEIPLKIRLLFKTKISYICHDVNRFSVRVSRAQTIMKTRISACILFLLTACTIAVNGQQIDITRLMREQNRRAWNNILIRGKLFNSKPNSFLAEAIRDLPPGKALDIAMGEGRNTLLLARNGWKTTGFDIADVAMDSARARAARENLKIKTVVASGDEFNFGFKKWDLIALIYSDIICGGCCAHDKAFVVKIKRALKPGGRLVYEFFTREGILELEKAGIIEDESTGCNENTIRDAFLDVGGFEIVHYSEEPGLPDWGVSRDIPIRLIYFIARRK